MNRTPANPPLTFSDIQIFTADMIQEDIDAMERGLEEITTNIG